MPIVIPASTLTASLRAHKATKQGSVTVKLGCDLVELFSAQGAHTLVTRAAGRGVGGRSMPVSGRALNKVMAAFKGKDLSVEATDKGLKISSGPGSFTLYPFGEIVQIPPTEAHGYLDLPVTALRPALQRAIKFVEKSPKNGQEYISGVGLVAKGSDVRLVATDSYKAIIMKMVGVAPRHVPVFTGPNRPVVHDEGSTSLSIPLAAATALNEELKGVSLDSVVSIGYDTTGKKISIEWEGGELVAASAGCYPASVGKLLDQVHPSGNMVVFDRKEAIKSLRAIKKMAPPRGRPFLHLFDDGGRLLAKMANDSLDGEWEIKGQASLTERIRFDADLLLGILGASSQAAVTLRECSAIKFWYANEPIEGSPFDIEYVVASAAER